MNPKQCPVCLSSVQLAYQSDRSTTVPNVILDQLIKETYPSEYKKREVQANEILELQKRLGLYFCSKRFNVIVKFFEDFMKENYIVKLSNLLDVIKQKVKVELLFIFLLFTI